VLCRVIFDVDRLWRKAREALAYQVSYGQLGY
jgi:hypothetical protein